MTPKDFDGFVTDLINRIRGESKDLVDTVLSGELEHDRYKYNTGVLKGLDYAVDILVHEANEKFKELYEEDE